VKSVHWSDGGDHVAVVGDESFYVLKYNAEVVEAAAAGGSGLAPLRVCRIVSGFARRALAAC
jgi:hypothetical protein